MLVSICGMPRSGSTFSFNIVREILENRGTIHFEATELTEQAINASNAQHIIIKNHRLDQLGLRLLETGSMKGVCTVRDPYDAIESWMDVFGFDLETSLLDFENWAASFHSLRTYALVINFKEIESRPIIVIWKIAKHLGIRLTLFELATLYKRFKKDSVKTFSQKIQPDNKGVLDIGFSYFDKKTFFHRRHVRERKLVKLTSAEREYVSNRLSNLGFDF